MKQNISFVIIIISLIVAPQALTQNTTLPEGAQTKWLVNDPEEIVSYLIFDPATVIERLPSFLRLITLHHTPCKYATAQGNARFIIRIMLSN